MKKSILLFSAILMTITALGFINWNITATNNMSANCADLIDSKPDEPLPFYVPKSANLLYDLGPLSARNDAKIEKAKYSLGRDTFIEYLKEGNKKNSYNIDFKKLQLAKLQFTVSKTGIVENIKLHNSSGYEKIDKGVIELLKNAPGLWTPAKNDEGENVVQELVISFGMGGC